MSMKMWVFGGMTVALVGTFGATALAQEAEGSATPLASRRDAFEIDVNTGYSRGFGGISKRPGDALSDVTRGGVGVGLGFNYRATPELAVGLNGQYQGLSAAPEQPTGTQVRGAAVGVEAKLHIRPYDRLDPWVGLGTGYRMLWVAPEGANNNVLNHGFQLARAQVGLDVRVSRDIALGPVIGGDVDLFLWRNPEGPTGNQPITDRRVSTFLFAGVQGRFDVGGERVNRTGTVQVGRR